ncbi:hypothetical protein ALC53_07839 [Atta colombica]|uniref:Ig-like domain-containing protein n=1 Tax=Atta colombica TaxID=520822 RepID=A0A195BBS8_9HYME|nr:hypothetical protein ALC53_07839 [Atta colombica]
MSHRPACKFRHRIFFHTNPKYPIKDTLNIIKVLHEVPSLIEYCLTITSPITTNFMNKLQERMRKPTHIDRYLHVESHHLCSPLHFPPTIHIHPFRFNLLIINMIVCFLLAEAENGAIERGINHLDEENQRLDERIVKNRTIETASWSRGNDTTALEEVISAFTVEYSIKDLPSLVPVVDPHFENASKTYIDDQMIFASKRIENSEQAEEALAMKLDHENVQGMNDSKMEKPKDDWLTLISVAKEEDVTEARYGEQKNAQDIRAISFQVPPPDEKEEDYQDSRQQGKTSVGHMDETRKLSETKKNQTKPANNLLLTGKSTKAFYEIKPSIRTLETERGRDQFQITTHRTLSGRKFVLPSVDSAFGKFGPYFEDGDREINVTARIGSTVLLDCKIGMLGDKKVTWLQHNKDFFRLLTVGRTPYSNDQRISLNFRYPSNWRLQILYANPRDSGLYQCQVATHPPLVKKINVVVTGEIVCLHLFSQPGSYVKPRKGQQWKPAFLGIKRLSVAGNLIRSRGESAGKSEQKLFLQKRSRTEQTRIERRCYIPSLRCSNQNSSYIYHYNTCNPVVINVFSVIDLALFMNE